MEYQRQSEDQLYGSGFGDMIHAQKEYNEVGFHETHRRAMKVVYESDQFESMHEGSYLDDWDDDSADPLDFQNCKRISHGSAVEDDSLHPFESTSKNMIDDLQTKGKGFPACALQGIAARWLGAHYKTIARSIARAMARGLGFVTPCPNKQGKNAHFSKVSDASGTACDAVNVRKDCEHFGPPLWVVPVEEEDLLADLVEFFCSGSAVQRSLWAKLEKRVPVSEAEKKRRRTKAANAVTPLSVMDLVLLLKIPRRRHCCARLACDIAHTSAHSTRFVAFCARYALMLRALFYSGTKI